MTTNIDLQNIELSEDVDEQNDLFVELFNSGDGALFDRLYRADAISNLSGGPLAGPERLAAITEVLAAGPKLSATVRCAYSTSDTRLIIVDFVLDAVSAEGARETLTGHCTDAMVRGADGKWIMAVDRPVVDTAA